MHSAFPTTRLRRLRYDARLRELVRQVSLSPAKLVQPLFVRRGSGVKQEIASMPGQYQWSLDLFNEEVARLAELRLGGVILFGIPDEKDPLGS
ncbi:MAG: porphobilinogen synthase, partial [Pirellulales bacterium]